MNWSSIHYAALGFATMSGTYSILYWLTETIQPATTVYSHVISEVEYATGIYMSWDR